MSELNNKVAVITGAGSGIGEAIAKALSQHGLTLRLLEEMKKNYKSWHNNLKLRQKSSLQMSLKR